MNLKIIYKDGHSKELGIACGNCVKVKDLKEIVYQRLKILSKPMNIPQEHIILEFKGVELNDDKYLSEYGIMCNDEVRMFVEAFIQRLCISNYKYYIIMEYGDNIGNLRTKYQSMVKVDKVILTVGEICRDKKRLRETECAFVALHPMSVMVKNKNGHTTSVKIIQNDTINILRRILIEKKFLRDETEVLMDGNNVLRDDLALCPLDESYPMIIFVGFVISVLYEGKFMYQYRVNVDTKISRLKTLLSEKCGIAASLLSLMRGKTNLDDGMTVGFYRIKEEETLVLTAQRSSRKDQFIRLNIVNSTDHFSLCKSACISVNDRCSVDDLRTKIGLHFAMCSVQIYYGEEVLKHGSIDTYGVTDGATLTLLTKKQSRKNGTQFMVTVRDASPTPQSEEVQRYLIGELETVRSLKVLLREQYNVNIADIRLLWGEEEWCDEDIIMERSAEGDCSVTMILCQHDPGNGRKIGIKIRSGLCGGGEEGAHLFVCDNSTVASLRHRIEETLGTLSPHCVLSLSGEILKNENLLKTYGLEEGSEVVVSGSVLVRYFVAGDISSSKVHRYPFMVADTVSDLKGRIQQKLNIESRHINLSFNGESLDNDKTVLGEAEVESGDYLMMVATLLGGDGGAPSLLA